MNARIAPLRSHAPQPARVALLGTGTVGSAAWARLASWADTPLDGRLSLVHVANSRFAISNRNGVPADTRELLLRNAPRASSLDAVGDALSGSGTRIVIDATASETVAERHASWLAGGIHVVTACKLGQGTTLARWRAIQAARARGGTRYGDSATVGAGLPLLRSLRELQAGGDRIHAVAGVLSGSLAWLFNHYDGLRPFSNFVRAARDAGYTEPDPRDDLSGEDVRRKLLILSRAAGHALEADAVQVDSLVPEALAALAADDVDGALPSLDAPLRERYAAAYKNGEKLRFIARLQADGPATVGLEALAADHPLAGGAGTDNRVAIWSDRYREQPLLIQGPGAGAGVTAAALLDDALRIAREA
ncbi:homoserine dehydrogenase [Thermomonas aquatica]|uniref:Homoserine dehydrogenase n=1 Tax=Thermomonas aquatica TaxID=2202149 RepID=A0A5B7ZTP1_9GAMM|nr:homoserine dehydrogenase [Thermomonas aquatica]QDA57913.1 homoserine dehydrogenase [Thermomonas aquatica]